MWLWFPTFHPHLLLRQSTPYPVPSLKPHGLGMIHVHTATLKHLSTVIIIPQVSSFSFFQWAVACFSEATLPPPTGYPLAKISHCANVCLKSQMCTKYSDPIAVSAAQDNTNVSDNISVQFSCGQLPCLDAYSKLHRYPGHICILFVKIWKNVKVFQLNRETPHLYHPPICFFIKQIEQFCGSHS